MISICSVGTAVSVLLRVLMPRCMLVISSVRRALIHFVGVVVGCLIHR